MCDIDKADKLLQLALDKLEPKEIYDGNDRIECVGCGGFEWLDHHGLATKPIQHSDNCVYVQILDYLAERTCGG